MAEAFFYNIYPSTPIVGGGPGPWIYSVAEQNLDAALGARRVQAENAIKAEGYMRIGAYFPVEAAQTALEESGGVLVNRRI